MTLVTDFASDFSFKAQRLDQEIVSRIWRSYTSCPRTGLLMVYDNNAIPPILHTSDNVTGPYYLITIPTARLPTQV